MAPLCQQRPRCASRFARGSGRTIVHGAITRARGRVGNRQPATGTRQKLLLPVEKTQIVNKILNSVSFDDATRHWWSIWVFVVPKESIVCCLGLKLYGLLPSGRPHQNPIGGHSGHSFCGQNCATNRLRATCFNTNCPSTALCQHVKHESHVAGPFWGEKCTIWGCLCCW